MQPNDCGEAVLLAFSPSASTRPPVTATVTSWFLHGRGAEPLLFVLSSRRRDRCGRRVGSSGDKQKCAARLEQAMDAEASKMRDPMLVAKYFTSHDVQLNLQVPRRRPPNAPPTLCLCLLFCPPKLAMLQL